MVELRGLDEFGFNGFVVFLMFKKDFGVLKVLMGGKIIYVLWGFCYVDLGGEKG